jgi:hypothetical protein
MKEKLIEAINKTESLAEISEIMQMIEYLFYYEIIGQTEYIKVISHAIDREDEIR